MSIMFVWVGKEAGYDVIVICRAVLSQSYWPSCVSIGRIDLYRPSCIGRVASELAELLCIGRVCHSYDSDRFCNIQTVLLIVI